MSVQNSESETQEHEADPASNNRLWSSVSTLVSLISGTNSASSQSAAIATKEDATLEEDLACPICYDIMSEVYVTICGHSYCYGCITCHLKYYLDCPICRSPLTKKGIFPNFQLNKLAQSQQSKQVCRDVFNTQPKDPIPKIIKDSQKDNSSIANSLVDLLSFDDLESVCQVALERKKKALLDENKLKKKLLAGFLFRLRSNNKKKIRQLIDENYYIQLDSDLAAGASVSKKRKYFAIDKEEQQEISTNVENELADNYSDNDSESSLYTGLEERMEAKFDDLKVIYQKMVSVNETIKMRRKLLTQFSSTLFELTKYGRYDVVDTLYYTATNRFQNATSIVSSIDFDRDDELFAVGGVTRDIKVYDFSSMGVKRFSGIHCPLAVMMCRSKISCISWSPYIKSQLASSDYDGFINVWDTSTGQKTQSFSEHKIRAWSVDICRSNPTMLASGSDDSTVKIWSLNQNESVCTLEQKGNVCCAKFSPSQSHLIAVGSADNHISCYDLRYPNEPVHTYHGHTKAVSYVKWLNENELVSASTDSTLKLWNKETTECTMTFTGHYNEKNFVGLSTNDNWISCGSENNTIYTYHKSSPTPATLYKFSKPTLNAPAPAQPPAFVSSVCWKSSSNKLIGANSKGIINVLQMK